MPSTSGTKVCHEDQANIEPPWVKWSTDVIAGHSDQSLTHEMAIRKLARDDTRRNAPTQSALLKACIGSRALCGVRRKTVISMKLTPAKGKQIQKIHL